MLTIKRKLFAQTSETIAVYSDMTSENGVGVTVTGHDSESRTLG